MTTAREPAAPEIIPGRPPKAAVIRPMMNLAISYDHRTIDGADAGRFLQTPVILTVRGILFLTGNG